MPLKKLSLKDKALFEKYLSLGRNELSAYSFQNIFIWSELFCITWEIIGGNLCVFFNDRVGCFMYFPPLGENFSKKAIYESFKIMDELNKNKSISRIENVYGADIASFLRIGFKVSEKFPEYVCKRADLSKLAGDKFKSKRAPYNYFCKNFSPVTETLKEKTKSECLDLYKRWADERKSKYKDSVYQGMIDDSFLVLKTALSNYRYLGFDGLAVRIETKLAAFSFGFKLNKDTFCILFEVADLKFKGISQYIFREFAKRLTGYKFINIMDDSGLENIRKTKLSFYPHKKVSSFIISRSQT